MIWTFKEDKTWAFDAGEEIAPGLEVIRFLADGTEAELYLAHRDGKEVVVKIVRPHLAEETHPVEGLRREAAVLRDLDHRGIVHLIDEDLDGDRPHLVLTFVPTPTLAQKVENDGAFDAAEAARWCSGITDALAHVHDRGFVHLDINPSNVTAGARPCLLDFGVARRTEAAAQMKSPAGTDAYMAPEQTAPADRGLGPAADVWSVGATMFFALTGARPFPRPPDGPTGPAGRWPQLSQPVVMPPTIDPFFARVVRACLDPDPRARPSVRELAEVVRERG